jgi:hypothetical protein
VLESPAEDTAADIDRVERGRLGRRLLTRMLLYHASLAVVIVLLALLFPSVLAELPVGGVRSLAAEGDVTVSQLAAPAADEPPAVALTPAAGDEIAGGSLREATSSLDRLGYARRLVVVLIGLWLVMLPVSWVQKGIHRTGLHDHSLDETTLILPGVVAAIVLVVQHSLALAFSLAGIVAGVQFRRALQDTFDALFILVAIGAGIAAGVQALEIAAVLAVFFSYATLYVCFLGDGLESDYLARKKLEKRRRKDGAGQAPMDAD